MASLGNLIGKRHLPGIQAVSDDVQYGSITLGNAVQPVVAVGDAQPIKRVIPLSDGTLSMSDPFGNIAPFPATTGVPIDGTFAKVMETDSTVTEFIAQL